MLPINLHTERLTIREVNINDAPFLKELVNSPGWLKYIGDRNVTTEAQALAYTQSYIDDYSTNGFGFYVMQLKESKKAIGISGLIKRPELTEIDFGFALLPEYYKQGFTYEASVPILSKAFKTLNIKILLGITTKDNIASQKLLNKLGFNLDGTVAFKDEILLKYKMLSP